jgi:tRNA A37 threonylcarbamoyladenosine biosynthesis protein TsaE
MCFVEWPEKALALLPIDCFKIFMEILDEKLRRIYTA